MSSIKWALTLTVAASIYGAVLFAAFGSAHYLAGGCMELSYYCSTVE